MQLADRIRKFDIETATIQRSAAIAVENIKQHVGNLRPKFEESTRWARHIVDDQSFLLGNWQSKFDKFHAIPVFEELRHCLQGSPVTAGDARIKGSKADPKLVDFVEITSITKASKAGGETSRHFKASITDLINTFEKVSNEAHETIDSFSQGIISSDSDFGEHAGRLIEEVEVITKKINADYEYVLGLPKTQKTISQVSKTALLHTRNLLPSLKESTSEIAQLLRANTEQKNQAMMKAVQYLQKISVLESTVAKIHAQLANLGIEIEDGEAFDILSFVINLPLVYGALLVECVRRREWNEKMTADSSSLVEEIATFKEEEAKRRKKWSKDMGGAAHLENIDDLALNVEVNIQAQKQKWPNITRQDVIRYIQALRDIGSFEEVRRELEDLLKTLDSPTKQQAKRAKAFKNGSIHEASFGKNSLLLRGDDDLLQSIKNDKSKLEDKLKSSESRIRKLEDLLHRQTQIPRASTGNAFGISNGPSFERHATSPVLNYTSSLSKNQDSPSRQSSVSSRRISMNHEPEEKALTQRILSLEAELTAERAQSGALQKKAAARLNAEDELKLRMQEAVSTKEDLMGNLEAQQREFDGERRSLEDENSKLKLKLEEVEDELDRVLENRDHEGKVHLLEAELEKVRRDASEEMQTIQRQMESLQDEAIKLERQVQDRVDENTKLDAKLNDVSLRLQEQDRAQAEYHRILRAALLQLSKDEITPEDLSSLVNIIETTAEKAADHLNHLKQTLEMKQAENDGLESRMRDHAGEITDLQERLGTEEIEVFSLRESLAEQKTQFRSLQGELENERRQCREMETESTKTKTDSKLLQEELGNREKSMATISHELTLLKKQAQELESLLNNRQSQLDKVQKLYNDTKSLAEARASRAENVSSRLYRQNVSLVRLLEQIGFTVTKQEENTVIQKVSRAVTASTVLNDPAASMSRSVSGPLPTKSNAENILHANILKWASDEPDQEAFKFNEYIQEAKSFDIDVVNDAIIKRVKETEHTTRKWQREARAYRDKAHRAQNEAHEKIAFRTFKEGDLALFLPTRNQATRPWAAFNVGAPHYFLREQDSHKLRTRDWLLARISKVEERMVDLSKSINGFNPASDRRSIGDTSDGGASFDDENPFELSDGLRWYLLDAAEEKPGAPINIGLSKVTVASANVDAKGSIRMKKPLDGNGATKTLTRSLDSRRNSSNSKKGLVAVPSSTHPVAAEPDDMLETNNDDMSHDPQPSKALEINIPSNIQPPEEEVRQQLPGVLGYVLLSPLPRRLTQKAGNRDISFQTPASPRRKFVAAQVVPGEIEVQDLGFALVAGSES